MSNRDPEATYGDPVQSIEFAIREWARQNIRTAVPGIVRAYDARSMRARVQPALNSIVSMPDGSDVGMEKVPIYDVPVVWPGGGGFVFHTPLNDGDTVWLMFSERGIWHFKRALQLSDPPPMVMFDPRDAVALPWQSAPISAAESNHGGDISEVTPTSEGPLTFATGATIQAVGGESFIQVRGGEVKILAGNITLAGNVSIVDGGITNMGTNIGKFHRHDGVQTGPGQSGPPV